MSSDVFERLAAEFPHDSDLAIDLLDRMKVQGTRHSVSSELYAKFLGVDIVEVDWALAALSSVDLVTRSVHLCCPNEKCEARIPASTAFEQYEEDGELACPLCNAPLTVGAMPEVIDYIFDPQSIHGAQTSMSLLPHEKSRMNDLLGLMDTLTKKLGLLEHSRITKASASVNFEDDDAILKTRQKLAEYDQEFAQLAVRDSRVEAIPETEAAELVQDVSNAMAAFEMAAKEKDLKDVLKAIAEVRDAQLQPKAVWSAKLKVLIPIIPKLARIEVERDLGSSIKSIWARVISYFKPGK